MGWHKRNWSIWVGMGMLFLVFTFRGLYAQPAANTTDSVVSSDVYASLLAEAQTKGQVRILVGLELGWQPAEVMSAAADTELQQRVATVQEQIIAALALANDAINRRYSYIPALALSLDADTLQRLATLPLVRYIEPDRLYAPLLRESAGLIQADDAWAAGFRGEGQVIAILDTGVDATHPFLNGKVVSEACYSSTKAADNATSVCPNGVTETTSVGSGVPCNLDGCNHGTHVAGIAAGQTATFSGIAPGADVIAIQVFSQLTNTPGCNFPNGCECRERNSPCSTSFTSDYVHGLERVLELRHQFTIAAVNLSLGRLNPSTQRPFTNYCNDQARTVTDAIARLRNVGIAVVAASGNDYSEDGIRSPACIRSAISVGSIDDGSFGIVANQVSDFSNSAGFLDLLAPGRWINSSVPGRGYDDLSGTSMAAPHVAGAIALLREAVPSATVDDMVAVLKCTGIATRDARNGIIKPRIQVATAIDLLGRISPGVIHLHPGGNDSNSGAFDQPFQTLGRGVSVVGHNGMILTEPGIFNQSLTIEKPVLLCTTTGRKSVASNESSGNSSTLNLTPAARTDTITTVVGTSIVINALSNDSDADGNDLIITLVGVPDNGTATTDGATITYTPNAGFTGTDGFTYNISDDRDAPATGSVIVIVQPDPNNLGSANIFLPIASR